MSLIYAYGFARPVERTGLAGVDNAPVERIDHAGYLQNKMRAPARGRNLGLGGIFKESRRVSMTTSIAPRAAPASSSLYDVLDLILDKGLVVDAYVRVSVVAVSLNRCAHRHRFG